MQGLLGGLEMTCPVCSKPSQEEIIRQKRDGSLLMLAKHDDGTGHYFHEWPNMEAFMYRKYASDVKRRRGQE